MRQSDTDVVRAFAARSLDDAQREQVITDLQQSPDLAITVPFELLVDDPDVLVMLRNAGSLGHVEL